MFPFDLSYTITVLPDDAGVYKINAHFYSYQHKWVILQA
jgi:hypothetical protein